MATSKETNEKYAEIEDLLHNIVCKEMKRAAASSTADSEFLFSKYSNAVKQKDSLYDYEIALNVFHAVIPRIPISVAEDLINHLIPYEDVLTREEINKLLLVIRKERVDNYVEENNYYRMILGLPPFETTPDDYVYYKGYPIHDMPLDVFYDCKHSGYLDVAVNENPDKPYIWYIGKNINLIHAREAGQFDILWTKDGSKYNKYRECYNKEKSVFMQILHSEYLCGTTDYAEARELVTIKLQAIILFKLEMNSSELDKAEFTVDEAIKIWKEFGLTFPKNMVESYRNTTTFLLNYLVSMKGTNKVLEYISDKLFTGIKLYKYFIRKTHKVGATFPLPPDSDPMDFYNVEFILRPFYATNIGDYKENDLDDKVLSYDEVVAMDPKWRDTAELKRAIFESDFSYVESKYLSLDNFVDLSEFTNTFSVFSRILIEHSELLKTKNILVPSVGYNQNAFSIFVYYLALITKFIEGKNVTIPDSIDDAVKLMGFKIPPNINELRVKFAWFFTRSDYSWLLDRFPDAINTNDSFFNFVVNTDKVIGLDAYMYDLLESCKNWPEYELASSIFNLVKLVNKSPSSYGLNTPLEGKTYQQWLFENAPAVFDAFNRTTADEETFIIEMDSITQVLIKFFESQTMPEHDPVNIKGVINTFAIMTNGISKYLLYILNLFKAYSSEFLNESVAYFYDKRYNVFKQIENIRIDGRMDIRTIDNYSDWDGVIITRKYKDIFYDGFTTDCGVYLCSAFGDIKINNQGG